MKTPARNLQAGDSLRMIDGTWITVRRATQQADLMRITPEDGHSFTVLADARWEIRKAEALPMAVEPIDVEEVRARARKRFTL